MDRVLASEFLHLPEYLSPGDLLIVNDAATFPASLKGVIDSGEEVEIRLLPKDTKDSSWTCVLFGKGNWRSKTELRSLPPILEINQEIIFDSTLKGTIEWVHPKSNRLVKIGFNRGNDDIWKDIYRLGKPVQYSYLEKELDLWSVQTSFGSRPCASEMPSAGYPLNWQLLLGLMKKGIEVCSLTHATGLSSTGDPVLDGILPFPEFFHIPETTVFAVREAHRRGNRVIAVGTSVVRAIEGQVLNHGGNLVSGSGQTSLIIKNGFKPQETDGILTGIHEIGESHFHLLEAFVDRATLQSALGLAEENHYLLHEFGDSCLIISADPLRHAKSRVK